MKHPHVFSRVITIVLLPLMLAPLFLSPISAAAAAPFRHEAWIAYWKKMGGAQQASANLNKLKEISPFSYEVNPDGTLVDKMKLSNDPWPGLFQALRTANGTVIPTVSWQDGDAIDAVLQDKTVRAAHEKQIVDVAVAGNFDGIDIDYENKKASTTKAFVSFLKELSLQLHADQKTLTCSIEARTPAASRFVKVPPKIDYANNFVAINKYCDQVRLLAYGQGNVDLKLNKAKGGDQLYAPIADPAWIRKVVAEAAKSISRRKIVLGVATYGYEYEVGAEGLLRNYKKLRSVSYQDALATASSTGATPMRNSAGELSFMYTTSTVITNSTSTNSSSSTPVPSVSVRLVWFPDAASIAQKVKLAKTLGLRGVAIFKLEDDGDQLTWSIMP